MHRAVPRPVRRRWGRVARRAVRAPGGIGPRAQPRIAHRAPALGAGGGRPARPTSSGSSPGMMEVFAGFLTHTDAPGRPVARLHRAIGSSTTRSSCSCPTTGRPPRAAPRVALNEYFFTGWELLGERGGHLARIDDLGTPKATNHYPWGGRGPGNTPLRLWKRYAWLGGVRTPLVVRWGAEVVGEGAVRPQFCRDGGPVLDRARRDRRRRPGTESTATCTSNRSTARSLLRPSRSADAPRAAGHRSTSSCWAAGRSTTPGGRPRPTTSALSCRSRREALIGSPVYADRPLGAATGSPTTSPRPTTCRPTHPGRGRGSWSSCGGPRPGATTSCPSEDALTMRAVAMDPNPNLPRHTRRGTGPAAAGSARTRCRRWAPGSGCASAVADAGVQVACAPSATGATGWAVYLLDGGRPGGDVQPVRRADARCGAGARRRPRHEIAVHHDRPAWSARAVAPRRRRRRLDEADPPGDLPLRRQIGGAGLLIGRVTPGSRVRDDYEPPFPLTDAGVRGRR